MAGNHGNSTNLVKHQRCNGCAEHDEVRWRWSEQERRGGAAAGGDKGGLNKSPSPAAPARTPSGYRRTQRRHWCQLPPSLTVVGGRGGD